MVRRGWSKGFMMRGDKGKESDYGSLNSRLFAEYIPDTVLITLWVSSLIPITLVRDDWSTFTDDSTKPHRGKLASPGHVVSSGRGETQGCKTPKTLLFPTF